MTATREQIREALFLAWAIPKNSYELSSYAMEGIYHNLDLPPRDFIFELLKDKFDCPKRRFNRDEKLALACHEIVKLHKYAFDGNPIDKNLWIKFRQGRRAHPEKVLLAHRQLWRGYSEDEVKNIQQHILEDKDIFQNVVDKALKRNSALKRSAQKDGNRPRVEAYNRNEGKLRTIQKNISGAFSQNPELLSRCKLVHRTLHRRRRGLGVLTTPYDYLHVLFNIQINNPDLIAFPLRFMGHLPCTTYDALSCKWLEGCSRDEMMLTLMEIKGNGIPDLCERLLAADEILAEQFRCRRAIAFKEIAASYESGHYIAATLLATTQTEGVLWDFARYLNRHNIRIFKEDRTQGVRWPYLWNRDKNAYVNTNPKTKRPICSKERIYSAGGLLDKTRLGSFIHPSIISYLVDDFIQDRNPLMHGVVKDRDYKPNAIAAINCIMACYYEIFEYVKKVERQQGTATGVSSGSR